MAELTYPGRGALWGSRYSDQRPYVVSERLDDLGGPVVGEIVLSRRLDWSGRARYDLDNQRRLTNMYETVLREATTSEDLQLWLNGPTLLRLWAGLVLPPQVRLAWEAKHPVLAEARRAAASASRGRAATPAACRDWSARGWSVRGSPSPAV